MDWQTPLAIVMWTMAIPIVCFLIFFAIVWMFMAICSPVLALGWLWVRLAEERQPAEKIGAVIQRDRRLVDTAPASTVVDA